MKLIAVLAVLVLAGCAKVGPDFAPPDMDLSQGWLEQRAVAPGQVEDARWWRAFGDQTLETLVAQAAEQNLTLRAAGLRVLQARAMLGTAVGNLYPQDQRLVSSLTHVSPSDRAPTASQDGGADGFRQLDAGLTAAWELDLWGRLRRGVEAAQAELAASRAGYDDVLVSLQAEVARSYISLRTFEDRLRIAQANAANQRESLRIAEARFRLGATGELDVRQAQALLFSTLARIPELEDGQARSRHALALLLGRPAQDLAGELGALLAAPTPIPQAPATVAAGLPADLLRRRPDVRRAELAAWAQCARIGVARAELFPALSLSGAIGFTSSSVGGFALGDLFEDGFRAQAGPSAVWKLFNYGRLTNAVRFEDARFQERLTDHRQTVLAALREVEDFLSALRTSGERTGHLAQSSQAAASAVELALRQYQEGATDFTTVLTAQQGLLNQQDALAASRGDSAQALVGVYRALGGGWQVADGLPPAMLVPEAVRQEMAGRTDWGALLQTTADTASVWPTPDW